MKEKATIKLIRGKGVNKFNQQLLKNQLNKEVQEVIMVAIGNKVNEEVKGVLGIISTVISKYATVFEVPTSLPPNRIVDHAIPI